MSAILPNSIHHLHKANQYLIDRAPCCKKRTWKGQNYTSRFLSLEGDLAFQGTSAHTKPSFSYPCGCGRAPSPLHMHYMSTCTGLESIFLMLPVWVYIGGPRHH